MRIHHPSTKHERGVTILIVAISLLVLVTMAALAIDIASLYQAHAEAQRAADAAALAGARMFATSSYTSTTSLAFSDVCNTGGPGSTVAVNKQAEAAAKVNSIAGQPAVINNIQCANANVRNPRVTVTVESVNSPTFFSKIWAIWGSTSIGTVKATATAEAYNPSGQSSPIGLTNVKPWLLPNCDPGGPSSPSACPEYFIDTTDGSIRSGGAFIGKILHLSRQATGEVGGDGSGSGFTGNRIRGVLSFYGLDYLDGPAPACPSTGSVSCGDVNGGDTYIDNIACTSSLRFYCGQHIGSGTNPKILVHVESPISGQPTEDGTKCLIHASGTGANQGQDEFSAGVPPVTITGGSNNPNPSLQVPNISRSDSVVTAMLYKGDQLCFDPSLHNGSCVNDAPATVIGFLQLGVQQSNGGPLVDAVVLNAVGCSPDAIAAYPPPNPVFAGGSSPIPIRLVKAP